MRTTYDVFNRSRNAKDVVSDRIPVPAELSVYLLEIVRSIDFLDVLLEGGALSPRFERAVVGWLNSFD